ncbi:MAG: aromatic acid decarboxylase [Oceanospirillales bacterium LUC14_002_19_P2]|nr:MAG: aromatic acid decarboxylase [Oceanospirillales bacterium LUC14_002_19_P2]
MSQMPEQPQTVTLALTGASGVQYGLRLLECLVAANRQVYFLLSKAARVVIATETNLKLPSNRQELQAFLTDRYRAKPDQIRVLGNEQWMSAVASGSGAPSQMVVCPASTGTLSAIATGASNNLIERAGDVALKEQRQLIIVPRETPYSAIHLEHMLSLTRMGAVILPASPGFYNQPATVDDMVDFIVARILNHLGIAQNLMPRWGE